MKWLRALFTPPPPDELAPMRAGFAAMIRRALEEGDFEGVLQWQLFGCSISGEPLGDWEFTVRRLRPAPVGRNAKRQDPQGLGPKDEHAVTREARQAPTTTTREGYSHDR